MYVKSEIPPFVVLRSGVRRSEAWAEKRKISLLTNESISSVINDTLANSCNPYKRPIKLCVWSRYIVFDVPNC